MPPETGESILTVMLFTDLVGSTAMKRRMGDPDAARAVSAHDRLFRECLAKYNGVERDDTGDGFFATFNLPSDAVRFALAFHQGLAALDLPTPLITRVGIHMGEILRVPKHGARGVKLVGLAIDTSARVMSLAQGRQILLTRHAFDSVRQQTLTAADGTPVQCLAHGPYVFKGVDDPLEIFEVGLPGFSPLAPPPDSEKARRAIAPGDEATLGWRPAAGLTVPGRETWVLQRKLGEGGFGEVWLAQHGRTHEVRTFKFCFEADRLRTLKREMTLFRLMKEVLGERADIARLYDVQFDTAPYFLEMDYATGGDLATWAAGRGGIGAIPLSTRLELVAQVADALAAAHSVGVIHKDVKPANVLIDERKDGTWQVRLTDFGIGQLVTNQALTAAGLSATAFEPQAQPTLADYGPRTGTQLYMAPELTAGKAPSIRSDIYALGVLLYQVVVGDLAAPLAHGWERTVPDELLREDITACISGTPEERLPAADPLARRLRTLDERRAARAREHLRANRERQRRRLLRLTSTVAAILLTVVVVGGVGFWRAVRAERQAAAERDRALAAEQQAAAERDRAVVAEGRAKQRFDQVHELAKSFIFDFHDQIVQLAGATPARQLLVTRALQYLDSLSAEAADDQRLRLDLALAYLKVGDVQGGLVAGNLGQTEGALESYEKALAIATEVLRTEPARADARRVLCYSHERLGDARSAAGQTAEALAHLTEALRVAEELAEESADDPALCRTVAVLHNKLSGVQKTRGRHTEALEHARAGLSVLQLLSEADPNNVQYARDRALAHTRLAEVLLADKQIEDALTHDQQAMALYEELSRAAPDNAQFRRDLAIAHYTLGDVYLATAALDRAASHYEAALERFEMLARADPSNAQAQRDLALGHGKWGDLAAAQGRVDDALRAYDAALGIYAPLAQADPQNVRLLRDIEQTRLRLGDTLVTARRPSEALEHYRAGLQLAETHAAGDPASAEAARDVALAYCRLGAACVALGAEAQRPAPERLEYYRQARQWYERAQEQFSRLRARGALTDALAGFLALITAELEKCDAAIAELSRTD